MILMKSRYVVCAEMFSKLLLANVSWKAQW